MIDYMQHFLFDYNKSTFSQDKMQRILIFVLWGGGGYDQHVAQWKLSWIVGLGISYIWNTLSIPFHKFSEILRGSHKPQNIKEQTLNLLSHLLFIPSILLKLIISHNISNHQYNVSLSCSLWNINVLTVKIGLQCISIAFHHESFHNLPLPSL